MYLRKRKSIKIINTLLVIALLSVVLTVSVYAADVSVSYSGSNDISMSSILHSDVVKTIKNILVTLLNPIASVSMGASLIGLTLSSSQKQSERLLRAVKAIVWAFALANLIGLIFTAAGNIVGSNTYTFS